MGKRQDFFLWEVLPYSIFCERETDEFWSFCKRLLIMESQNSSFCQTAEGFPNSSYA